MSRSIQPRIPCSARSSCSLTAPLEVRPATVITLNERRDLPGGLSSCPWRRAARCAEGPAPPHVLAVPGKRTVGSPEACRHGGWRPQIVDGPRREEAQMALARKGTHNGDAA